MFHSDIFARFLDMFWDTFGEKVKAYGPAGKDCVEIEMADGNTLMFTWYNETNWSLRTKGYK